MFFYKVNMNNIHIRVMYILTHHHLIKNILLFILNNSIKIQFDFFSLYTLHLIN